MRFVTCIVNEASDGETVDYVLRMQLFVSNRFIRHARKIEGAVILDGMPSRTDVTVHAGQEVGICVDDEIVAIKVSTVEPQEGPLDVVYEDEDLILVNKPAGLVMHPSRGHADHTMINYLLAHLRAAGQTCNPHPVQRLDVGTTGLVAFTTSGYAQDRLQDQMHTDAFVRTYLALVKGAFEVSWGTVDAPIGRYEDLPGSYDVHPEGKEAITHYTVLSTFEVEGEGPVSLVKLVLDTGRTHQIRVHMKHLGHPLVGDVAYGEASEHIDRAALHSWMIEADHPVTRERLVVKAPLPDDLAALVPADQRAAL